MQNKSFTLEEFFTAWVELFQNFMLENYHVLRTWTGQKDKKWNRDVLRPIVERIARNFGLSVVYEQPVPSSKERRDFVLSDERLGMEILHIEHENSFQDLLGELIKLQMSRPSYKVGISYAYEHQAREVVDRVISPSVTYSLRSAPEQQWLFILVIYRIGDKSFTWNRNGAEWSGYLINAKGSGRLTFCP